MHLKEIMDVICRAEESGLVTVRLHTGDPSVYGAIREQIDELDSQGIAWDVCPGVTACFGAAASLGLEYTLPGVSQSLIVTRMEGRTAVPEAESIESLAAHRSSMAVYLSAGMIEELAERLVKGGYREETPAAIVYKASWPDEKKLVCTIGTLKDTAAANDIKKTAVILVGDAIGSVSGSHAYECSRLYAADFETGFRRPAASGNSAAGICLEKTETQGNS